MPRSLQKGFVLAALCLIISLCAAAQDAPPKEKGKLEADLVELTKLDNTIKLDIRYATANNFVGRAVYPEARAFLQRPAAEAVVRVHRKLEKEGLGLVIFDGYRPWSITKLFWSVVREDQKKYVADPATGSRHNRGCAVDLSIYDLRSGKLVTMPSGYDEFTERASPDYKGGSHEERANRDKLRALMEAEGFTVNANEWWHFDYKDWQQFAIYDIPFDAIGDANSFPGFVVRRIEFSGNIFVRDRALRELLYLREGDLFDKKNLTRSIESINRSGLFETLTEDSVSLLPDSTHRHLDFVFFLKEKPVKK